MSESGDYTPAPHWSGYDFATARNAYKDVVDRSYSDAVSKGVSADSLIPECVTTDAEAAFIGIIDVTGSMGAWPATIFSKLPYLEHELAEYLGDDVEVSFGAIGDALTGDKYPLQIQPFVKGVDLKTSLEKLVHERGGGCNSVESYELGAMYYARNCETPKAIRKPILVFIGDEGLYGHIDTDTAERWAKVTLKQRMTVGEIFAELKRKFNVYVIRKPYGGSDNYRSPSDIAIEEQWIGLVGSDHVVSLPDPSRVVDVIFGILAKETGRTDYFVTELKDRQLKDVGGKTKVDVVLKSLHTILAPSGAKTKKDPDPAKAKSVSAKSVKSVKSKSLLD